MGKNSSKWVNWEPDVRKGLNELNRMNETRRILKEDADRRKIDGFNPGDVGL